MFHRIRRAIRSAFVRHYAWLRGHDLCPCMVASRIDHAAYRVYLGVAWLLARFGRLCAKLDGMIRASDGLCEAGCAGCNPQAQEAS